MDTPFANFQSDESGRDPTERFLERNEELAPGAGFDFACHPAVPCFNACCSNLTLNLTPYDALRLRRGLDMASREFIGAFAASLAVPGTGLAALRLKMLDNDKKSCPFVRPQGCSVYGHRPSSCRTYPLGRATRPLGNGRVEERHFIIREPHCKGFAEAKSWTAEAWFADQDLKEYNRFNDLYTILLARLQANGPMDPKRGSMAFLALYQPDDFTSFCQSMGVFDRLGLGSEEREQIQADEARALEFGFAWLDLLLFKDDSRLKGNQP